MSEKEIRETLDVLYKDFYVKEVGFDDHTASAVYGALDELPDVVAVARKIVDEVCKCTLSPEQVWAVGLIKRWMEETFKFRLTDDGYEWTEEKAP